MASSRVSPTPSPDSPPPPAIPTPLPLRPQPQRPASRGTPRPISGERDGRLMGIEMAQVPEATVHAERVANAAVSMQLVGPSVHVEELVIPKTVKLHIQMPDGTIYNVPFKKKLSPESQKKFDRLYCQIQGDRPQYEIDIFALKETFLDTDTGKLVTQYIPKSDKRMKVIEEFRELYSTLLGSKFKVEWPTYSMGSRGRTSEKSPMFPKGDDPHLKALRSDDAVVQKGLNALKMTEADAAAAVLKRVTEQRALYAAWKQTLEKQIKAIETEEKAHPDPKAVGQSPRMRALKQLAAAFESVDLFALDMGALPLSVEGLAPNAAAKQVVERTDLLVKLMKEQTVRASFFKRKYVASDALCRKYALGVALQGVHDRTYYETIISHPDIFERSKADPIELALARASAEAGEVNWMQVPPLSEFLEQMAPADREALLKGLKGARGEIRAVLGRVTPDQLGTDPGKFAEAFRKAVTPPAQPAAAGSP